MKTERRWSIRMRRVARFAISIATIYGAKAAMSTSVPISGEELHAFIRKFQRMGDKSVRHLVRGTDIPLRDLVVRHLKGYAIEEIREDFPELSLRQIQAALRFYRDHPNEFRIRPPKKKKGS